MTKKEVLDIIQKEELKRYNFEGTNIKENEVGILNESGLWKVYDSDEKASIRIIESYSSENEAIEHVLKCLRINKRFEERRKRKKNR